MGKGPTILDYASPEKPLKPQASFWQQLRSLWFAATLLNLLCVAALLLMAMVGWDRPATILAYLIAPLPTIVLSSIGRQPSFWTSGPGCPGMIVLNALIWGFCVALLVSLKRKIAS